MSYFANIKTFVRVYELGSMSAAARDQRISPAVASARISQLEDHLNVRLFQRTTRMLTPTEQGKLFYPGACRILESIEEAEALVSSVTLKPRGSIYVAAPLGIGRRLVAPAVPDFKKEFPLIDVRMRLSDRKVDLAAEGLDVAFFLGVPEDSNLRIRKIADCRRVLCASPRYLESHGEPKSGEDLSKSGHACLNLHYPGSPEFQWPLQTAEGVKRFAVSSPFESDDGDVLTDWALNGHGIVLKPEFEVLSHIRSGDLVPILTDTPPVPIQMACLYSHRRRQDPKIRMFIDFISGHIRTVLSEQARAVDVSPRSQNET